MYLARVIGSLQASVKHEDLAGVKLLYVQPVNADGTPAAAAHVACDATQSGRGDLVYCCDGREATLALRRSFVAVDATIVAIVDALPDAAAKPRVSTKRGGR